jgi:hypothetical protein
MSSQRKETQANASKARVPPALDPESPGLTQPWKDFSNKGWISEMTLKKTPFGWNCTCQVSPLVSKEEAGKDIAFGVAKQLIIVAGLWTPKGPKVKNEKKENELPKKTIVQTEVVEGAEKELLLRAQAVAGALGDNVARGRIGSLKFMREGIDTFDSWWKVAPAAMKSRLFMDEKQHKLMSDQQHELFARVVSRSPFRGSVPSPSSKEEDGNDSEDEGGPVLSPQEKAKAAKQSREVSPK